MRPVQLFREWGKRLFVKYTHAEERQADAAAEPGLRFWWEYLECVGFERNFYYALASCAKHGDASPDLTPPRLGAGVYHDGATGGVVEEGMGPVRHSVPGPGFEGQGSEGEGFFGKRILEGEGEGEAR